MEEPVVTPTQSTSRPGRTVRRTAYSAASLQSRLVNHVEGLAFSPVGIFIRIARSTQRGDYPAGIRPSRANWLQCKTIRQSVLGDFYSVRDSPIGAQACLSATTN